MEPSACPGPHSRSTAKPYLGKQTRNRRRSGLNSFGRLLRTAAMPKIRFCVTGKVQKLVMVYLNRDECLIEICSCGRFLPPTQ